MSAVRYVASTNKSFVDWLAFGDCPAEAVFELCRKLKSKDAPHKNEAYVKRCEITQISNFDERGYTTNVYQVMGRARAFKIYPHGWEI